MPSGPTDRDHHRHDDEALERLLEAAIAEEQESGRHEPTPEAAKRSLIMRVAIVAGGTVVLILGILLLALPGPGLLVVALGLAMLATEIPFAARLLERVRARLPQDADGKLPKSTIVTMVLAAVVFTGASVGFSVWRAGNG